MDSAKKWRWIIPFKKFGMKRVKNALMTDINRMSRIMLGVLPEAIDFFLKLIIIITLLEPKVIRISPLNIEHQDIQKFYDI